jgi:P27 family predicted phage terminase small subunit
MATAGRKSLPDALRAPPRKPCEAKAREAKAGLYPRYDPADLDMPPVMMEERVAAVWAELAPTMKSKGIITEADVVLFTTICEIIADMRRYQKEIGDQLVVEGANGGLVKHPLISPLNTLRGNLRGYLCEIGWTPGSRTKVPSAESGSEEEAKDPLADLLRNGTN